MEAAGIYSIREYIRRHQETISENVDCLPIYELCVKADRIPGMSQMVIWWDQDVVNAP